MKLKHHIIIGLTAVVMVAAAGTLAYVFRPQPVIPGAVKKQVAFAVFVPKKQVAQLDRESVKYDSRLGLLSFKGSFSGTEYVVSEQATPPQFSEIPDYYQKLRDGMKQYSSFDSVNGTVYLTRPNELQGKQAAVLNAKGTLVSVKAETDMSESQWRSFFNSIVLEL